jgi:hypothetical protein
MVYDPGCSSMVKTIKITHFVLEIPPWKFDRIENMFVEIRHFLSQKEIGLKYHPLLVLVTCEIHQQGIKVLPHHSRDRDILATIILL